MLKGENKELSKLININEDACEFYETAQEKSESNSYKQTFKELETIHKNVIVNLQQKLLSNGGDAEAGETIVGEVKELWGALCAAVSNDVDATLVKYLEEAEDRCLHSIKDAMQSDGVSAETKILLRNELETLQKSHDYMKNLKEQLEAA